MAVISNNGRLISSLPLSSTLVASDQLLIQSNGVTKRVTYNTLSGSILSSINFNPYTNVVEFKNVNNKFTGSLNIKVNAGNGLTGGGLLSNDITLTVDPTVVVKTSGNQTIGGTKTFSSTILGNITSTGISTFSSIDINGGAIDGATVGATVTSTVRGTVITATTGFVGNITGNVTGNSTGNLTGDVYNNTSTKVLESGTTTPTPNGGVSSAYFYGTSSYASQALTAAYAAAGGSGGLPGGGSQYQVISYNGGAVWTNPITASGIGQLNYITVWNGARELKDLNNFYYDGGSWNINAPVVINNGITTNNGAFTGSFKGYTDTVTVTTSGNSNRIIYGHDYPSVFLRLSASGYCTMSLMNGQTSTIFVQNSVGTHGGPFKVLKWSGSLDGGSTASTKIYWRNGLSASITQGDQKKDVITFVNINNKIFGSVVNNFQ